MPHCPLQDKRCGGCTRLSVPYEQQLQSKQKRIEKLFDRVMPISGMASPYRYRNKIIAATAHDRDGLLTGQYVYGTHYVLRQNDCLLENEEAVRIVKKMPNWIPGKQKGQTVRVKYTLPISFSLDKTK